MCVFRRLRWNSCIVVSTLIILSISLFLLCSYIYLVSHTSKQLSHDPDDIHFYLVKNDRKNNNQNLTHEIRFNDSTTLNSSGFQFTLPTIFLIHGYYDTAFDNESVGILTESYVNHSSSLKVNWIIVDWSKLSAPSSPENEVFFLIFISAYPTATKNVDIAGKRVGDFISWVIKEGDQEYPPSNIHLIGHSLGAHVCGKAGDTFKENEGGNSKIGRITGLDPAGPMDQPPFPVLSHILSPEDAEFVDVIHTNVGIYGQIGDSGHVDIYSNGIIYQPGCGSMLSWDPVESINCNHVFAIRSFAASSFLNPIKACKCSSPFWKGRGCLIPCKDPIIVGITQTSKTARGKYYFETGLIP